MAEGHSQHIPLSEKSLGLIIQAYKVGKVPLALLIIGSIALLSAFFLAFSGRSSMIAVIFLAVGGLFIGIVAYQFVVDTILPTKAVAAQVKENVQLLDAVQDVTLQLTDIISQINDFSLYHADEIVNLITRLKSNIKDIPFGDVLLGVDIFEKPETFARQIREFTNSSKTVITDVREAVAQCDGNRIKGYIPGLVGLKQVIETQLLPH